MAQDMLSRQNSLKTSCDELTEGDRRHVATLRLSRHIQRLVAKHVVWHINAALAPAKAASALAS
jgi:hypothetical protein